MNILVCMPVKEEHIEWLRAAAPEDEFVFLEPGDTKDAFKGPKGLTDEQLAAADVIIGNPPVDRLDKASRLRLLQLNSAGTGDYPRLAELQPQAALCCATGSYGLAISEHMLGFLLEMMKKLALYRDQQFAGSWNGLGFVDSIYGANALCVGLGDIGSAFAQRLHALGAHVTGIRRSAGPCPEYVDAVYTAERLDDLLPQADIVALSMPETAQTRGMMGREQLARMKEGAYLINVGRGSAVDQDALLDALRSGKLGGAALDVTTPEPLPADHPLWREPLCVITPHISGGFRLPATHDRIIRLACRNLVALREGRPLESRVDFQTGYRAR